MDQPPLSNFATDSEPGPAAPPGPGARATPLRGAVVRPFTFAALTVAALFVLPVATVLANLFASSEGTWAHLAATVLPRYVANTAWLVL
jgi:iron(III) transport system permease protein